MRILYVHYMDPESVRGGMGVHIDSSTQALRALGHDLQVLTKSTPGNHAGGSRAANRSYTRQLAAKYGYVPRALARTPSRIRQELPRVRNARADVLLVRYEPFEFSMWAIAARLKLPLVVEVNATSRELVQWKRDQVHVYALARRLERALLRRADRLFAVSNVLKRLLVEDGIAPWRIGVVPNGADEAKFSPDVDPTRVRVRYGLADSVVVGFLGSFGRWHDIGIIAHAARTLCPRHPRVRFLMAGAKFEDLPAGLRENFAALGPQVIFTGAVPITEAQDYMAAMDIALTVFPAISPFGPSTIKQFEYMAAGRAVIATDLGQQGEIIQDGVNGLLVQPGDTTGLEQAIERLIIDPTLRERLGHAARETIVSTYTWTHNARRVASLCQAALEERGARVGSTSEERVHLAGTAAPTASGPMTRQEGSDACA